MDANDVKQKKRDIRNARRRKRRLESQTGIDWVDPEKGYGKVRGEQALWRAVILQMLEDATSQSRKTQDQHARTQARNWLEGRHADFIMVCDMAGLDVQYVRKKIKKALQSQQGWRRTPTHIHRPIEKKSAETNDCKAPACPSQNTEKILLFPIPFQRSA